MIPALLVHDGPHGVAAYSRQLAEHVNVYAARRGVAQHPRARMLRPDDLPTLAPGDALHVHFTDRLWGSSPEEAARAFADLARRHAVSVTLHDVPQPSDGERNLPRRRDCYAAVTAAARAVAVNSAHEAALLREQGVFDGDVAVLPLPVEVDASARTVGADGAIGVLGFFYPGKGHDEALAAASEAGATRLVVLGRASDGHADDLAHFVARAEEADVEVEVTGWLESAELAERARRIAVPVMAHQHVSASGSLASWIGYGRRPIAVVNRYVAEMAALRPGTVEPVEPAHLADAIRRALRDPESTWHGFSAVPAAPDDVAEAYLRWWGER